MTESEITQYTKDEKILHMKDWRGQDTDDELDYQVAQGTLYDNIHKAARVLEWARIYRGVKLDDDDLQGLAAELLDVNTPAGQKKK